MKNLKSTKGFTLVELIVVIAILGILAAVAVPAYTGYITKANEAADLAICDAAKTAVFASLAEEGKAMPAQIDITSGSAPTYDTDKKAVPNSFKTYYATDKVTLKNHTSAQWKDGKWTLTATAG